jgi:hypothetical protein
VLICSERNVLLADCWWLVCSEKKVLLAGGDKPNEQGIGMKVVWIISASDPNNADMEKNF